MQRGVWNDRNLWLGFTTTGTRLGVIGDWLNIEGAAEIIMISQVTITPVSYTHLDVYKRQDVIPGTHFQQDESTWGLKNAP